MKFSEIIDQAGDLLRRKGRITYRTLRLEFGLDEDQLDVLKEELIDGQRVAADEGGKVLVWVGQEAAEGQAQRRRGGKEEAVSGLRTAIPGHWTPPHLAERILAEQAAMEARGSADGERKTITALFADIKGSMELIEDLDPEEARRIVDPALQLMMEAVHRYEGYVAQSTGDGIFAFFGAPIAHEDHAQRALYAALRMQEEIKRYANTLRLEGRRPVEVRVGVNTGGVVVRSIRKDDLHADYVPIGHSTGLAARMESLATAGSIVVSEHTYRLTDGYFEFKALGAAKVKGVSEPINIYEVLGAGPLRTRLQVAARRGLVRFVGRQHEIEHVRRAWAQAQAGHGQIVGVVGEPGVGKSRLFHEFKLISQPGCLVLEAFSVSHGKAYPYLPLVDLLKNYFHIAPLDDERSRREKITGRVLTLDRSLEDTLPYLFTLLGFADSTSSLQQMDPQIRRRRTFEAIKRLLVRESLKQPLILIFEDLHWLDNETQAFLALLSDSLATTPILLLVNYRPEYRHDWGNKTYYTQLRLDPLRPEDAQELLTALLGESAGLQSLKQLILEKTEGNPFFMEEIVQALMEQRILTRDPRGGAQLRPGFSTGHSPSPGRAIPAPPDLHLPATVQGVLAARIDRLPPAEKALLQTLSVIGKEFSLSLLKEVVNRPEGELHGLLAHLQAAEFIYEQPAFPEVEYTFKHALTQEVAYNSLLLERRRGLHEQAAQAMELLFHNRLEDHYGDLAHHYGRSGNARKAVEYLGLAGQQAVQRSANTEAISHLTAALESLKALPDTPERAGKELLLQLTLGPALMATKGYAAPEVERAYTRARDLCQQMGDTLQLFPVLFGLCMFYYVRAEHQTAHELAEQFLTLARRVQDRTLLLEAYYMLGATLWALGEWVQAREHLEQSLALYDPQQHHSLTFVYGDQDPGVICQADIACILWCLGYPDQALQKSHQALTLAAELSHPHSLAFALGFAAVVRQYRREEHAVQERAEASITLASEHGFPMWVAWGTFWRGWALAEQRQQEEGIAQMRQGLAAARAAGTEIARTWYLATLAEAHGKLGQTEEGLTLLAEALAIVDKTGERLYEAELYRVKGELVLQSGVRSPKLPAPNTRHLAPHAEVGAEACFLKAIEIARRQQAKSLELRAVVSLSRLWQQQGKREEARKMLAEIYHWFTEGFDTKDLQEAKALLDELT
ncbi:MAG TPA: adenylate/guanylate cyclase domain-containing protein [Candidatus Binatia bacterium]|nr:adenylate/guanylate cyclase domain-containing protein [Candidatus Binatia bacterium]